MLRNIMDFSVLLEGSTMEEGKAEKIVHIARDVFEREGVRKTTISTIMREAGITRELFYYYFKNKPELIDAVLDSYTDDIARDIMAWSDGFDAGEKDFADLVRYFRSCMNDEVESCRAMHAVMKETQSCDFTTSRVVERTVDALRSTDFFRLCERHSPVPAEQGLAFVLNAIFGMFRSGVGTSDKVVVQLSHEALCLPDDI